MNSFSIQAVKDTLHDMHGVITSKVIPAVGTFLGKSVTFISANPLATAAVVAAVITVSLVIFAAYKHYQHHQQLKADVIRMKNEVATANVARNTLGIEKLYLIEEKKILKDENQIFQNQNANLKAKIEKLEDDRALDQEAAELVVADQFVKIENLEKQILSK